MAWSKRRRLAIRNGRWGCKHCNREAAAYRADRLRCARAARERANIREQLEEAA